MPAILRIILLIISIFEGILVASVVMSWLIHFNVINTGNQIVATIQKVLTALTEPLLRPIRRVVPNVGGLDLSPLVLLVGLYLLSYIIASFITPLVT